MKSIFLFSFLVVLTSGIAHAEYRTVAIEIFKPEGSTGVKVNIHSDVAAENKRNLDPDDAAPIIEKIQGWGSSVGVVIVIENVALQEYLDLLKALSKNPWTELLSLQQKGDQTAASEQVLKYFKIPVEK